MLRAKNPPSHFPLPGSASASLQCPFIQQLHVGLALIIGEGHATFRAGSIGGAAVGGAWRRSGASFDSRCGPVILGLILGVPGQHLARNVLHAGPCRLRRQLNPASPWRQRPCTISQVWHQPWDPESPWRVTLIGSSPDRPSSSWTRTNPPANLGKAMQASSWSLSSIHLVVVLGEHPLGCCPSTYAAHANKIV